jgi:hypothetical protein
LRLQGFLAESAVKLAVEARSFFGFLVRVSVSRHLIGAHSRASPNRQHNAS